MNQRWGLGVMGAVGLGAAQTLAIATVAAAQQGLSVVYPPPNHETTAAQIFLIGTAPEGGTVTINGEAIERSPAGHFAPSVPLALGENVLTLSYGDESLEIRVVRQPVGPVAPDGVAFVEGSLYPTVDIARQTGELICFEAIAPANAEVTASLDLQTIPLVPQPASVILPPNAAVLTHQNQPLASTEESPTVYQGCQTFTRPGNLGTPEYQLRLADQTVTQSPVGTVEILAPQQIQIAEVTAESGTARTGPSTDYSRLTPLPTGTRAAITGRDGEWYRLDYGAWIRASEVAVSPAGAPPRSLIRSIQARPVDDWTEVRFPLQVPVPVSVEQGGSSLTLTLHNTTAQTDTIFVADDPLIERFDWTQPSPDQVRYTIQFKTNQQWGYQLRYEGTTLVLALRHPPVSASSSSPLQGISILLDPGHGGDELGARGPTGYPEKDVNLAVSLLLRDALQERGATVYMTRETDETVSLGDRVNLINQLQPNLALSIHYNALPDSGDAINTAGIGAFWYHTQAHDLATFLHDYLTETLDRPSYGVFWNNLALTRPATAPTVLLELGFMINPYEFEWIVDPTEQQRLATALADALALWVQR